MITHFSMTVTKEDREQSGPYVDLQTCLMATMFRRRGIAISRAGMNKVYLKNGGILRTETDILGLYRMMWTMSPGCIVRRSAIGKTITFTSDQPVTLEYD